MFKQNISEWFILFLNSWQFSDRLCRFSGVLIFFQSTVSIYLMTVISLERFMILNKPHAIMPKFRQSIFYVCLCLAAAFVVCILPTLGWSHFKPDSMGVSCNVEWKGKSLQVISYNIFIMVVIFFIPLGLIMFFNVKAYKMVAFSYLIYWFSNS